MTRQCNIGLAMVLWVSGCGDDAVDPGATGDGTGGAETGQNDSVTGVVPMPGLDESGTTAAPPLDPGHCSARRHALLDDEPCGQVAIADLDGDGVEDVFAVAGDTSFIQPAVMHRRMYSYLGSDPLLGAPEIHCCTRSGRPQAVTALDINGDGQRDPVVTAEHVLDGGDVVTSVDDVDVWLRGPAAGYLDKARLARNAAPIGFGPRAAIGRFVAGMPSIVVTQAESILLYESDGFGLSLVGTLEGFEDRVLEVSAIDVDGDELDDIIARTRDGFFLLRNEGGWSFTLAPQLDAPVEGLMHVVDVNGEDAVVIVGGEQQAVGLIEDGALSWSTQDLAVGGPIAFADVDSDGALDLVATADGNLMVHAGAGDGTFAEAATAMSAGVGETVFDLDAGDLNGDGTDALVICDSQGILVVDPD